MAVRKILRALRAPKSVMENAALQRPLFSNYFCLTLSLGVPDEQTEKLKTSKNTRKNHSSMRAQLATQAVVRSRTNKRPVAAGATELEPSRESNSPPQVFVPE